MRGELLHRHYHNIFAYINVRENALIEWMDVVARRGLVNRVIDYAFLYRVYTWSCILLINYKGNTAYQFCM